MSCTALTSTSLKKVSNGNTAQVFAQTARLLWRENIAVLLNKSKSERQKQSGHTVSCTGKVLQQSRCHCMSSAWTLLWNLLTILRKMHSTQGVLKLCVNDLMLIICSSCTTVKYSGFQEDVCSIVYLNWEKKCTHFWKSNTPLFAEHYTDDQFCAKLAYLSDIFDQLNQLNVSIARQNSTVFLVSDKIEGFKKKLILWNRRVKEDDVVTCFHIWVKLGSLFSCDHSKCHNPALVSVVSKVCWLLPRGPSTWKPLDFGPILCGSCFRRHGSVHCVGKWTNGTISWQ